MTIFKTYLKVLNKNKWIVILYTAILLFFGISNFQTSDNNLNFQESKPDVVIINLDNNSKLSQNLIHFLEPKVNIKDLDNDEEVINDAIFYRNINYAITIPEHFERDFLNNKKPTLLIKSSKDYQASLAEMLLNRYLEVSSRYQNFSENLDDLILQINQTLDNDIEMNMTSKLDTNKLSEIAYFYNFSNYSMLAGCIYVICLILTIFKDEKIKKRTVISNTSYQTINHELFLANSLFAFTLAIFYIVLSIILIGETMFSIHGLLFIINFLVFTILATSLAFTLGNLIKNKNVINGIINVIALGSSFLCGAFVPAEFLPDSVLKIAHILPSYYFINNNEVITKLQEVNFTTLKPFFTNIIMLIVFILIFVILPNLISKKNRKI